MVDFLFYWIQADGNVNKVKLGHSPLVFCEDDDKDTLERRMGVYNAEAHTFWRACTWVRNKHCFGSTFSIDIYFPLAEV